jgi:hypothetical protein
MSRGFDTTLGVGTTDVVVSKYTTGISTTMSISIWLYERARATSARIFDQYNSSAVGSGIALFDPNTSGLLDLQFTWSTSTSNVGQWNFTAPGLGAWHHVLITYNATSTANVPIVYVDGVSQSLSQTIAPSGVITTLTGNWYLGNREDSARIFDGMLAHFAVWNGVILTPAEALMLYSGANPLLIHPEYLGTYLPLDGVNNPEIDYVLGTSSSITGTKFVANDPFVLSSKKVWNFFDIGSSPTSLIPTLSQWEPTFPEKLNTLSTITERNYQEDSYLLPIVNVIVYTPIMSLFPTRVLRLIPVGGSFKATVSPTTPPITPNYTFFPDQQKQLLVSRNSGTQTIDVGVFNKETVYIDKWLAVAVDRTQPFTFRNSGAQTVDVGVFNKETIYVDKWLPIVLDRTQPFVIRNTGSSSFIYTPPSYTPVFSLFPDQQEPYLLGQPKTGYADLSSDIFELQSIDVAKWLPRFVDRTIPFYHSYTGYESLTPNIVSTPALDLDDWSSTYPDKQKQFLQGQPEEGFRTVDIGVFNKETIYVDKWQPLFTDRGNRFVYMNTGSIVNIYPFTVIAVVGTFVPHKRRGQPGTAMRGTGGAGGSKEGQ